jgi:hypothetical protein
MTYARLILVALLLAVAAAACTYAVARDSAGVVAPTTTTVCSSAGNLPTLDTPQQDDEYIPEVADPPEENECRRTRRGAP